METMWTLHVENFGRIESADIEVSPLTLFVGDNNSGKSYLLALIYGLMCADDGDSAILSNLCVDSPEYQACAEWIEATFGEVTDAEKITKPFDDYACTIFENLWNRILEDNQTAILQSIFNANLAAGKISVTFQRGKNETPCIDFDKKLVSMSLSFADGATMCEDSLLSLTRDNNSGFIWFILSSMITVDFYHEFNFFIPTARTGFLLTYPALAKDAFSRAYKLNQNRSPNLSLTKPFTDFLGNLTTINRKNISDEYQSIIGFMERNIIHGQILVSNDLPLPEFYYLPDDMKTSLPMYLSSDVIKELTPLILTLQYNEVYSLFIEEPEMSLHPKLQQMMARVLIKIANTGTPVIAATHSDTILQHVNNMVKLRNLPEARRQTLMERFGFDPDDPISADNISMYQFDVQDNGKTVVRALKCGDYGFEVPTFYDPWEVILEQTRATEPDAEEYED